MKSKHRIYQDDIRCFITKKSIVNNLLTKLTVSKED